MIIEAERTYERDERGRFTSSGEGGVPKEKILSNSSKTAIGNSVSKTVDNKTVLQLSGLTKESNTQNKSIYERLKEKVSSINRHQLLKVAIGVGAVAGAVGLAVGAKYLGNQHEKGGVSKDSLLGKIASTLGYEQGVTQETSEQLRGNSRIVTRVGVNQRVVEGVKMGLHNLTDKTKDLLGSVGTKVYIGKFISDAIPNLSTDDSVVQGVYIRNSHDIGVASHLRAEIPLIGKDLGNSYPIDTARHEVGHAIDSSYARYESIKSGSVKPTSTIESLQEPLSNNSQYRIAYEKDKAAVHKELHSGDPVHELKDALKGLVGRQDVERSHTLYYISSPAESFAQNFAHLNGTEGTRRLDKDNYERRFKNTLAVMRGMKELEGFIPK